jgi:predicted MPP superfamily phosphohydrolase
MVSLNDVFLMTVFLFGHAALLVATFNRVHAFPLPRRVVAVLRMVNVAVLMAGPLAIIWWCLDGHVRHASLAEMLARQWWLMGYALICGGMAVVVPVIWSIRKMTGFGLSPLIHNHTQRLNVVREIGHSLIGTRSAFFLSKVPGNQVCELYVHDKALCHPRLPPALEGLTIGHLSDFHFTGKLKRDYFEFVIDRANALNVDIMAVTGDIVDKDECIDWIPSTLGQLKSRHGVYFVLGNHDKRVTDVPRLRSTLREAGLIDLAGRSHEIEVAGHRIALAGNELPWFGPPSELSTDQLDAQIFRILLSHSPDQLPWARQRQFDLMLAGHTHGGQIRFPIIGPVVSPSLYGVKYACGAFYEAPTLMHVSRGISGLEPIRINCAPELARLTLRSSA